MSVGVKYLNILIRCIAESEDTIFLEFFPQKWKLRRDMWTDSDRNMSHFFMKAYANFATFGYVRRHCMSFLLFLVQ